MALIDDKRTLRSAMLAWRGALSEDERRIMMEAAAEVPLVLRESAAC